MCVYFVMTSLGEPADLTVKNGENLFPPILSRKQETKPCWFGMKDVFVCCVCLRARRRCSSVVTCDNPVFTQLDLLKKKKTDGQISFVWRLQKHLMQVKQLTSSCQENIVIPVKNVLVPQEQL